MKDTGNLYIFYSDPVYKQKQSTISKNNWKKGVYTSLVKPLETRFCKNNNCTRSFSIKPYDPKIFCSKNCAASINNQKRVLSEITKRKITLALQHYTNPFRGSERVSRILKICESCQKPFKILPYLAKKRKFCSNKCAMKVIGGQTTSPRASKGKPGIRIDIHPTICFYSTWEANIARTFNLVNIIWEYAPKIFDLGTHTYRPDFYLPQYDIYIEVKNFMNAYSLKRDQLFRQRYPLLKLEIISKKEYQEIESNYKPLIEFWEA